MSIILFELKNEHLELLKHLRWSIDKNKFIVSVENLDEDIAPYGSDNFYNAINLILNGRPEVFDPLNSEELETYSDEEKEKMDSLYSELPIALEIILSKQTFEIGNYRSRYHIREWKKIN